MSTQSIPALDSPLSAISPMTSDMEKAKPKSKLRGFFSWKKGDKTQAENVVAPDQSLDTSAPGQQSQVPNPSTAGKRARSNTTSSRNRRSSTRSRPRALTSWDPPPLFQAYTQAVLHSTLEAPRSFSEQLFGGGGGVGHNQGTGSSSEVASDVRRSSKILSVESPNKHKRNISASSTRSMTEKLFVLVTSGYILQYKADGHHDRLPEKILELGQESVAFASDAIPGRHWVLQVSADSSVDDSKSPNPKSTWSKLPFRSAETKRSTKTFLLAFDSPEVLFSWLIAVRKEIEALGGLEYRPDTRSKESRKAKPLRHATSERFDLNHTLPSYRGSSTPPSSADLSPPPVPLERPPLRPLLPSPGSGSLASGSLGSGSLGSGSLGSGSLSSGAGSSVATNSSLDRLRESVFSRSDSGSMTTGTINSFDGSVSGSSGSPGVEAFPVGKFPMKGPASQLAKEEARKSSVVDPNLLRTFVFPSNSASIQDRRPSASQHLHLHGIGPQRIGYKPHDRIHAMSPAEEADKNLDKWSNASDRLPGTENGRPLSTLAPLPEPGTLRKPSRRSHRNRSQEQLSPEPVLMAARPTSSHDSSGNRKSPLGEASKESRPTSSYSLFPKRLSPQDPMPKALLSPPAVTSPGGTPTMRIPSPMDALYSPEKNKGEQMRDSLPSRRRTGKNLSIEIKPLEVRHLQTPTSAESFNRSPAVTDQHFATNFGTQAAALPSSVHGQSDLKLDLDLLSPPMSWEIPYCSAPAERSPRRNSPQSPAPNLFSAAGVLPLGPPPSGPLPAVPGGGRPDLVSMGSSRSSSNIHAGPSPRRVTPKHQRTSSKHSQTLPYHIPTHTHSHSRGKSKSSIDSAGSAGTSNTLGTTASSSLSLSLNLPGAVHVPIRDSSTRHRFGNTGEARKLGHRRGGASNGSGATVGSVGSVGSLGKGKIVVVPEDVRPKSHAAGMDLNRF